MADSSTMPIITVNSGQSSSLLFCRVLLHKSDLSLNSCQVDVSRLLLVRSNISVFYYCLEFLGYFQFLFYVFNFHLKFNYHLWSSTSFMKVLLNLTLSVDHSYFHTFFGGWVASASENIPTFFKCQMLLIFRWFFNFWLTNYSILHQT